MSLILAIVGASIAWFLTAGVLFFNPPVDRLYNREAQHPAVKVLPQGPSTLAKILLAVVVQCSLWAGVYLLIADALGETSLSRGLLFGLLICLVKVVPRDIDRVLLTTYPPVRMGIEVVAGVVCAFVVGGTFAALL